MSDTFVDPYLLPQTSVLNRLARALWQAVYLLLFRPSPRPLHAWRASLLRGFGARLGRDCHVYARCTIWAPWNLSCDDGACIADGAVIYNAAPVHLGSHAIVSQDAYLCGATHDIDDPAFPMVTAPISIGPYAWVCARATVLAGVRLHEGAVLGLGAVASRDLEAWQVYGGIPARRIRPRAHHAGSAGSKPTSSDSLDTGG
jgi:putative colanic acid biosynthesis acetyltransferase WcaF